MRKIAEVLRLHFECGRSRREIALVVNASPTTVGQYLSRAQLPGLTYPLPDGIDEGRSSPSCFRLRFTDTFLEATWSQQLPDWIGSHVCAFAFLGGVTALLVPDNLKSGVKSACFYEPDLNLTCQNPRRSLRCRRAAGAPPKAKGQDQG